MLSVTSATVNLATPFSQTITVLVTTTDPVTMMTTTGPDTVVPTVTSSFKDPGVTVITSPGTVVISGQYNTIIQTTWSWLDKTNKMVSDVTPPAAGTYNTIFKVDSPTSRTQTCTYTINGSDAFVHTVLLPSYDPIATKLKTLLAATP
jgi:hypothetical protein